MASGGDAKSDLLWLVVILIALGFVWVAAGGPSRANFNSPFLAPPHISGVPLGGGRGGNNSGPVTGGESDGAELSATFSRWRDQISLNTGNAQDEYRPGYEHISIYSSADMPISLAGWRLANSRGYFVSLPYTTKVFWGGGANLATEPIILNPGDEAIITTGKVPDRNPFPINASFRVNKCSGYLGELERYQDFFEPSLNSHCPAPETELDLYALDEDCADFIEGLGSCTTPEEKRIDDEIYFDGVLGIKRACRALVTDFFHYNACVLRHQNDPDFFEGEWRVYLNQRSELWDDRRETITLYDEFGKIVDQVSYD